MEKMQFEAALEAVLFAAGEPVSLARLAEVLEIDKAACRQQIQNLNESYQKASRGIYIAELGDAVQLCTKSEFAPFVKKALEIRRDTPLSNAAMETLSIIAYNQPVTRGFIDQVRGVSSSQTVASLVEKGLVEEAGRLDVPGRPIAFKTTANFLRCFSLKSLETLPPLPDDSGQMAIDEVVGGQEAADQ